MAPIVKLFLTSGSILVALSGVSASVAAAESPHVVFILADDMGYGDVSCNNPGSRIQTPNIDQIAADGIRFTDAHAGGSWCVPSRYSLMTGRFAVRTSMNLAAGPLIEPARMTVASLLRSRGYKTAMVGKWHLGFQPHLQDARQKVDFSQSLRGGPLDCGFETFFGMHASLDIPPYFFIRDRQAVVAPTSTIAASSSLGGEEEWNKIQGAFWRAGRIAPGFEMDEVTSRFFDEAVKVIEQHQPTSGDRSLFLYLALPSPHTPWLPEEPFRGRSGAGMYGDFVMQVDAGIGRVVNALQASGMRENTLVVFSSDNGPVWYDKDVARFGHRATGALRGMKFSSWEGGHRMPFVACWPERVPAGQTCAEPIAFADVFATLAEVVGQTTFPAGTAEDSESFLPCLMGQQRPRPRRRIIHDQRTIREGDWKLIMPKDDSDPISQAELYDLSNDIGEQTNRIADRLQTAKHLAALRRKFFDDLESEKKP